MTRLEEVILCLLCIHIAWSAYPLFSANVQVAVRLY